MLILHEVVIKIEKYLNSFCKTVHLKLNYIRNLKLYYLLTFKNVTIDIVLSKIINFFERSNSANWHGTRYDDEDVFRRLGDKAAAADLLARASTGKHPRLYFTSYQVQKFRFFGRRGYLLAFYLFM